MMNKTGKRLSVLLVGESWSTVSFHVKGFDQFITGGYDEGATWLTKALEKSGIAVNHLTSQSAPVHFPGTMEELKRYDTVILSDVGSNSLLLHPDTFIKSKRTPNRLLLLKEYVAEGGGLAMIGGYMSFQGIDGRGRYAGTPVEEVLPVQISRWDDRMEVPEGFEPEVLQPGHPILENIDQDWPFLLGYNQVKPKEHADVLIARGADPLLATATFGKGRTLVFTSDCAPHWAPPDFVNWRHYPRFWTQVVGWLAARR